MYFPIRMKMIERDDVAMSGKSIVQDLERALIDVILVVQRHGIVHVSVLMLHHAT